jgi:hypothetical protein
VVVGFGLNGFRSEPLSLSGALAPPPAPEPGADLPAHTAGEALGPWEEGAFFLDVRARGAYDDRRVAGAFSFEAERSSDRYFDVVAAWGDEIPLFVYGAGPDSFAVRRVAAELIELGHDVGLVVCGLDGLVDAGLDFEEGPAEGMP